MRPGITKEYFLEKAGIKWNNKYSYDLANFINGKSIIKIICPIHGEYQCSVSRHLDRRDCPKCRKIQHLVYLRRPKPKQVNLDLEKHKANFLKRARDIYGNKFIYDETSYVNTKTKMRINCSKHGWFEQQPLNHLRGDGGCPKCQIEKFTESMRLTNEDVISRIRDIHGNKYNLEKVKFVDSYHTITLICPDHGDFNIYFSNIYSAKQGCQKCNPKKSFTRTSFNEQLKGRKAYVYLIKATSSKESFYKIGITININSRFNEMKRLGYNVDLISKIESYDGSFIYDKEVDLHRKCKNFKYKPQLKFGGVTECFEFNNQVLKIFNQNQKVKKKEIGLSNLNI